MEANVTRGPARIPFYKDWFLLPTIGLVFLLDQVTKLWVEDNICYASDIPREGTFQLTCSFNSGSAFGLFPEHTALLIIASFVGVGVLLLVYRHHPAHGPLLRVALGLQLGGAVGNLIDRIRFGQVTDFVKLGPWPVFNLADACIVVGITILVVLFIFSGRRRRPAPAAEPSFYLSDYQSEDSPRLPGDPSPPEDRHADNRG